MATLCENLKTMKNINPAVDVRKDLVYKPEYMINSFFAIGHFEAKGHTLNYLLHMISMGNPGCEFIASMFSVTDETEQKNYSDTQIFPINSETVSFDEFYLKAPHGQMSGDIDEMKLSAGMKNAKLDVKIYPQGYPIFNGGTGCFHMVNLDIYQYSIPHCKTIGTLVLDGEIYELDGMTWFDRQWQIPCPKLGNVGRKFMGWAVKTFMDGGKKVNFPSWGWMDMNLDNGEVISVWFPVEKTGEDCWATVMHPDGTQKKVKLNPIIAQAENWWKSSVSDYAYPTKYHVQCPELDADLTVICAPKEQELNFEGWPTLSHYEGASQVSGIYGGQKVTGYCYVETIGVWNEKMLMK